MRGVFADLLPQARLPLLYDVSHNTCKVEVHAGRSLYVHRKGATRAWPSIPICRRRCVRRPAGADRRLDGHRLYVLAGTKESEARAFSSACHGAAR